MMQLMVATPVRKRRSHQQRLDEAADQAHRAAVRLARKLHQVEKYETAAKLRDRRQDTRRKIIAGALALQDKDPAFRGRLHALIDEYVLSDRDRELFGLAPIPSDQEAATAPRAA